MTEKYHSRLLPQGALIEFVPSGAYVKVCAVDPVTGEEAIIVGDAKSNAKRLAQEAVRKLEYILRRKLTGQGDAAKGGAARGGSEKGGAHGPAAGSKRTETPSGWDM